MDILDLLSSEERR